VGNSARLLPWHPSQVRVSILFGPIENSGDKAMTLFTIPLGKASQEFEPFEPQEFQMRMRIKFGVIKTLFLLVAMGLLIIAFLSFNEGNIYIVYLGGLSTGVAFVVGAGILALIYLSAEYYEIKEIEPANENIRSWHGNKEGK
jgi:hypothetical protein